MNYNGFVVVSDGDGAVEGIYGVFPNDDIEEVKEEAINDAKELARRNKYGSYTVYGYINDEYDDDTVVYSTYQEEFGESRQYISEKYLSDEDIAAQYDDFNVEAIDLQPRRWGDGYVGRIEVSFPNAEHEDFEDYIVDNFYVYDRELTRFGFENWYPDEVAEELKRVIQKYAEDNGIINDNVTVEHRKRGTTLLSESFNVKNGKIKKKDGSYANIAYIDPHGSDSTYQYKDIIKNKFQGIWFPSLKSWGWFLNANPEVVYHTKIKPCLQWLDSQINDKRDVTAIIDKLIQEVGSNNEVSNKEDITERLKRFKEELISIVSDEEFKAKMEPIIKFQLAQGHQFSFLNALLVLVQDPNATLVKSKKKWLNFNREVEPNAPAIWLWIPTQMTPLTRDEKSEVISSFLRKHKASSVSDLHPGLQEELSVKLSGKKPRSFELLPYFFDVRFTKQIEGKEDLVGNPSHEDIPWFSDSKDETEQTIKYFDSLMDVVRGYGIKVDFSPNLGGARGVSKNGKITLLANEPKNTGMVNTFIHEFAHELLHQTYLKSNNPELEEFCVGRDGGRPRIEQQAELCAWIVMRNYGYDMPTNINYVGLWGLNKDNAVDVFDSVARTAQFIVNKINSKLGVVNESKIINESFLPNGEELANMLGYGDLYREAEEEREEEESGEMETIDNTDDTSEPEDTSLEDDVINDEGEESNVQESKVRKVLKESFINILKSRTILK